MKPCCHQYIFGLLSVWFYSQKPKNCLFTLWISRLLILSSFCLKKSMYGLCVFRNLHLHIFLLFFWSGWNCEIFTLMIPMIFLALVFTPFFDLQTPISKASTVQKVCIVLHIGYPRKCLRPNSESITITMLFSILYYWMS